MSIQYNKKHTFIEKIIYWGETMNLAENIANLRKNRSLTQAQLAEALNITAAAVSKWETGAAVPDLDTLVALADYFRVPMDELLGRTLERNKSVLFCPEEEVEKVALRLMNIYNRQILGVARSLKELENVLARLEEQGEKIDTLLMAMVNYKLTGEVFAKLEALKERYHCMAWSGAASATTGQLEKLLRVTLEQN